MKRKIKNISIKAYSIYAILCYLVIMIVISPFMVLSLFFKEPTRGNAIYTICNYWSRIWYVLVGIKHQEISTDSNHKEKQYIYISNHRSYMDIVSLVRFISQPTRVLGRHDIASIPLIGYFYKQVVITVDRKNLVAKVDSIKSLKKCVNDGLSIFIFPEGSFNVDTPLLKNFYDGAFKIAIDTKLPIKPLLFVDNVYRMNPKSFLTITPGLSRTIVLEEISVENYNTRDVQKLKELVYQHMESELGKYQQ